MFLARKITLAKWRSGKDLLEGEISADAVTVDLRTKENSLSFWQCGDEAQTKIEDAALAIASGWERVDKLDIVWIAGEELEATGQRFEMYRRTNESYGISPTTC